MKPGIIRISDMRFWGRHGANPGERDRIQPIDRDVEMQLELEPAIDGDDLSKTIDYASVLRACERIVTQESFILLESLADACLVAVLENPQVERATVRVRKPRVLAGATPEIELSRTR
jgi:dihydroneopterin aldolase